MNSQYSVGTVKLASGAAECAEGLTLSLFACTHVCAHPFVEFGPPVVLTHRATSLFLAQMPTEGSIMGLKRGLDILDPHCEAQQFEQYPLHLCDSTRGHYRWNIDAG